MEPLWETPPESHETATESLGQPGRTLVRFRCRVENRPGTPGLAVHGSATTEHPGREPARPRLAAPRGAFCKLNSCCNIIHGPHHQTCPIHLTCWKSLISNTKTNNQGNACPRCHLWLLGKHCFAAEKAKQKEDDKYITKRGERPTKPEGG